MILTPRDVKEGVLEWLQEHNARIEHCLGLTVVELPKRAQVEKQEYDWHWCVWFYGPDSNQENSYLDIEVAIDDAQETVWKLARDNEA